MFISAPFYAESGGVRPFGVSLMLAGYDDNGPQLYQVDPSGSYFAWKASAIGKNMINAKAFLEKRYSDEVRTAAGETCRALLFGWSWGAWVSSTHG